MLKAPNAGGERGGGSRLFPFSFSFPLKDVSWPALGVRRLAFPFPLPVPIPVPQCHSSLLEEISGIHGRAIMHAPTCVPMHIVYGDGSKATVPLCRCRDCRHSGASKALGGSKESPGPHRPR